MGAVSNDRLASQRRRWPGPGLARGAVVLLAACHPEPAALVTLLTSALALTAGRGWGTLWVTAAVAAGQLAVGWSNDYLDRELDRAARRIDKPLARQAAAALSPTTVRTAALLALAASVPLSVAVTAGFAVAHLVAVGCALAYNAGLKAGPFSVVPYAVAFGLLPVAVALGLPTPHWPPAWAVGAAVLIGAGGHFTQALPDIPADRRLGIRGLPQLIGQPASGAAAAALLLAANLLVALAATRSAAVALAVVQAVVALALTAGILAATAADRTRLAFRLTLASATVAVLAFAASGGRL
jgi:4-hydroxybenzoate polyprenyltransferase